MKLFTQPTPNQALLSRFLLFSAAALLALTPAILKAHTIKIDGAPGAASVGEGPADSSATLASRTGTLTTELLNLMTAAQIQNGGPEVSEEYFTLDTARSWGAGLYSPGTSSDVHSNGRAASAVGSTLPNLELIGWAIANPMSNYNSTHLTVGEAILAQLMIGGRVYYTGPKHSTEDASTAGNRRYNPFERGKGEFVLSATELTEEAHFREAALSLDEIDEGKGSPSAVPEPRFDSLLLFAGIMTALLVYRRTSRAV